jgi:hypothetical protein
LVVLITAVVLLVASVGVVVVARTGGQGVWAGARSGFGSTVPGPGVMAGTVGTGARTGAGMMGGSFGLPGDGQPVTTMAAARTRAQAFAVELAPGLHAGEVMQFSNGYYSELMTADGQGATEVLIDQDTGAVSIEQGPALMWNTRYGMHPTDAVPATISSEQATTDAQAWLDAQHTGLTAGEVTTFPGYDTLHTLRDGKIVGMMSVNAATGAAWYHTWHVTFVAMDAG